MVMSVNPILCVTDPRWLTRGMFSSVGWLPFLNCAAALPARAAHPATKLKTYLHALRIDTPILSPRRNCASVFRTSPDREPIGDRRWLREGVSKELQARSLRRAHFRRN